jgi:hypothetical protein
LKEVRAQRPDAVEVVLDTLNFGGVARILRRGLRPRRAERRKTRKEKQEGDDDSATRQCGASTVVIARRPKAIFI